MPKRIVLAMPKTVKIQANMGAAFIGKDAIVRMGYGDTPHDNIGIGHIGRVDKFTPDQGWYVRFPEPGIGPSDCTLCGGTRMIAGLSCFQCHSQLERTHMVGCIATEIEVLERPPAFDSTQQADKWLDSHERVVYTVRTD